MRKSIAASAVVAVLVMLPLAANAESDMSQINRERKAIGRSLVEINPANWTSLLPYYTEDIEYHDPIVSIEGIDDMTEFLGRLFESSPTLITTVEEEICINDMYAATWTMEGDFNGLPYSAKGMSNVKFRPGETSVYYSRDYYTEGDIMINIPGLDEPTEAFRTYYRCAVDPTFNCPIGPSMADAGPENEVAGGKRPSSSKAGIHKSSGPRSDMSRIGRERKAIGRSLVEINPANWTSLLQYYTEDIEYHDPIVSIEGIDGMTEFLGRLFASSPNLTTTVEDEICIDDMYAATWTMEGDFNGVPFSAKGMSNVKFRPGETSVYYSRDYYTEGDIMINIPGLDEPTEAFRTYYRCAVDPTFNCPIGPSMAKSVPEPATLSLLSLACVGLLLRRWK